MFEVHQTFFIMPGGEILGGVLSSAIPVVGAGISAALERKWALQDQAEQRQYNSPQNQLRLLEEAGLPAAAYFASGAGAQSEQPRATNVDPTLGTAEGVQNYFQTRQQQASLKLMDAQIRNANADADIKEGQASWMKGVADDSTQTNQTRLLGADMTSREMKASIDGFTSVIQGQIAESGNNEVLRKLRVGELDKLIMSNDLLKQALDDNKQMMQFKRDLATAINEGTPLTWEGIVRLIKNIAGAAMFSGMKINSGLLKH